MSSVASMAGMDRLKMCVDFCQSNYTRTVLCCAVFYVAYVLVPYEGTPRNTVRGAWGVPTALHWLFWCLFAQPFRGRFLTRKGDRFSPTFGPYCALNDLAGPMS